MSEPNIIEETPLDRGINANKKHEDPALPAKVKTENQVMVTIGKKKKNK